MCISGVNTTGDCMSRTSSTDQRFVLLVAQEINISIIVETR